MTEKHAAGRSQKGPLEQLKDRLRGPAQPGWRQQFSRDRSRQPSRAPSPVPSGGKADDAQATADSTQKDNMWMIAEAQLRQDKKMNNLLDRYYDILKSKLKEDLKPAGTLERRNQISAFILSESNHFHDTSKSGEFAGVFKKAADCILNAEKVISAATQPCLPASIACAGVMLVLSVSSSLQLHTPDADTQIALCSSQ